MCISTSRLECAWNTSKVIYVAWVPKSGVCMEYHKCGICCMNRLFVLYFLRSRETYYVTGPCMCHLCVCVHVYLHVSPMCMCMCTCMCHLCVCVCVLACVTYVYLHVCTYRKTCTYEYVCRSSFWCKSVIIHVYVWLCVRVYALCVHAQVHALHVVIKGTSFCVSASACAYCFVQMYMHFAAHARCLWTMITARRMQPVYVCVRAGTYTYRYTFTCMRIRAHLRRTDSTESIIFRPSE
jgi:hypothetical protein